MRVEMLQSVFSAKISDVKMEYILPRLLSIR